MTSPPKSPGTFNILALLVEHSTKAKDSDICGVVESELPESINLPTDIGPRNLRCWSFSKITRQVWVDPPEPSLSAAENPKTSLGRCPGTTSLEAIQTPTTILFESPLKSLPSPKVTLSKTVEGSPPEPSAHKVRRQIREQRLSLSRS